jgi:hypothetical protein
LLSQGKISCLANDTVSPLNSNNTKEIGTLCIAQCFRGITDLSIGVGSNSVEVGNITIGWVPSALTPINSSLVGEEETDVVFWTTISFTPIHSARVIILSIVGISIIRIERLIDILIFGPISWFLIEEASSSEWDTIIIENIEIGEHTAHRLNNSYLHIGEGDELGCD